jgi:predicted O-methyltransferase YrrM
MKKNVIYWVGVKNDLYSSKYGNFEYFEYSKNTWKYWCEQNNCEFVEFSEPVEPDLTKFRINWQKAIFVFDELERRNIDYDQICLVDSSCMIKWDAPNFFELTNHQFTGWIDNDNMKWIYDSIVGYKDFFDGFKLDQSKYISSGFIIFNQQHKELFNSFKELYYNNIDTFVDLQDNIVKKGTEQTPFNYWLQINNVDVNLSLPMGFKLTHMHRKTLFHNNWQLKEDTTPYFIKYGYNWIFNGIPKDQRPQVMKQTWDLVKSNYIEKTNENILDEMDHKDTAKYTTSKQFKTDLLDLFRTPEYKEKTVVEIGASQGQSTRLLSYIFKKVIAVEWDDFNLSQAQKRNIDRHNVEFIKMDLYNDEWRTHLPPKADVVFIDAGHQYHQVKSDILNSLRLWDNPVLIFDDYGLIKEVKEAVDEQINNKTITFSRWIGSHRDNFIHASGAQMEADEWEGCICNLNLE